MKKITLPLSGSILLLSACSLPGNNLNQWMQDEQNKAKNNVRPVEVPTLSKPSEYVDPVINGLNIFDPKRARPSQQSGINVPNPNRPKEILENFSLENLRYVGSIKNANGTSGTSAFIEAEGHTYTVKVGNYLGQNHGRITSITPDKIILTELVENSYGEWENRSAELELNATDNSSNQSKTN